MRVAELCAGVSGLALALRLAGWPIELAWLAEVDPDASAVLAAHHPGVPNIGDITTAQFTAQEPVEVVTAGWPCPPFSLAGKQLGAADERHIWPTGVYRSLRVLRPRVFVGENVPGLLTNDGGRVFRDLLADLDGLGYSVAWTTIGACRVGACHHRHRVIILAVLGEAMPPEGSLFGLPLAVAGKWTPSGVVTGGQVWPLPSAVCGASGIVLPTATPYGNNQSPSDGAAVRPSLDGIFAMLPTPRASDADKGGPNQRGSSGDLMLPSAVQPGRFGDYEPAVRRHEATFGMPAPEPTEPGRQGKPRLSAVFPEWMMGFQAGWITDHASRKSALRMAGNGLMPQQGALALSLLAPYLPVFLPEQVAA